MKDLLPSANWTQGVTLPAIRSDYYLRGALLKASLTWHVKEERIVRLLRAGWSAGGRGGVSVVQRCC